MRYLNANAVGGLTECVKGGRLGIRRSGVPLLEGFLPFFRPFFNELNFPNE